MNSNLNYKLIEDFQSLIREVELQSGKQIINLISHELRNPLAIISSNLQLLKEKRSLMDENMLDDSFSLCEEAIQSMTGFISGICFLNNVFKGELKAHRSWIELDPLLDKLVRVCAPTEFNRSRVRVEKQDGLNRIYTDGDLLRRILTHLLGNALSFSSEIVRVELTKINEELVVRVSDKGIGIPEDEKHLIFEPFTRCRNVNMISGSGTGLTIVKACVELLGGMIDFESVQNQGTTFIIKIGIHESPKSIDH